MLKWTSKNGGTEPENQGPEPQSARAGAVETHFPIFWKNRKIIEKTSISASFFSPFLTLFRGVSRKPEKGAQGPAREPQKHTKMDPKGAQTEPTNRQTEPQGPTKYEKHTKISHQGWQSGAPSVTMESQGPLKSKKSTKRFPKVRIRHENVPQSAKNTQAHIDTNSQPTNQPRKQRETRISNQANKRTNTPIHLYTNKNPNN